jgi:hypothetical protein
MTLINNLIELLYISASMGVDSWSDLLAIELIHLSALSKNDVLSELVELFLLLTMQKLLGFLESREYHSRHSTASPSVNMIKRP